MFTKILLIQQIEENGDANFHVLRSEYLQWLFENRRAKIETDPIYFPFLINSGDLKADRHKPGPETKISAKENEIIFSDDYAVPAGFTIAILFPENYIPDVLKFKDKPVIPIGMQGQFTTNAQGHFQILYSQLAKRSAIVFNIHQNVVFGFKCIARKVSDGEFPKIESLVAEDFFDIIIDKDVLNIEMITNEDLRFINEALGLSDLDQIKEVLNEVLNSLKSKDKKGAKSGLDKLGKYILNGTSFAGNLTKIIDSYRDGGAPFQFISHILNYP
jgi:hypothetical protein